MDAVLLVDKPAGPTSFGVVAQVRRALPRRTKVGHAGTLDPFATGLLLLVTGRATRLAPFLVGLEKRYRTTVRLGVRSDTGDVDGQLTPSGEPLPAEDELRQALQGFVGELDQVPPAASAVKVAGQRAYALARAGQVVELEARRVRIHALELCAYDQQEGLAELDVRCSKGTYIRSLARDLGETLGCGAHCQTLRRTAIGRFEVVDAGSPDAVAEDPPRWSRTPADALSHLPARHLTPAEEADVAHGRALALRDEDGPTRCLAADGRLLGVAEPDRGQLRPRIVLEPGA
jgi:tRNA pseudouridine55 synthase